MSTNTRIGISVVVVLVGTFLVALVFGKSVYPPDVNAVLLGLAAGAIAWGITSVWAAPKQPPQS